MSASSFNMHLATPTYSTASQRVPRYVMVAPAIIYGIHGIGYCSTHEYHVMTYVVFAAITITVSEIKCSIEH